MSFDHFKPLLLTGQTAFQERICAAVGQRGAKVYPNERRLSATTEDARKDPGRLLCDERRVSTRAEGQHQDPGRLSRGIKQFKDVE